MYKKAELEKLYEELFMEHLGIREEIIKLYKNKEISFEEASYELHDTNGNTLAHLMNLMHRHLGWDTSKGCGRHTDTTMGEYD